MSRIIGLVAGDIVICTNAKSGRFTLGREYKVTSHLNVVDNRKKRYTVSPYFGVKSTFVKKAKTTNGSYGVKLGDNLLCLSSATAMVIVNTTLGGKDMRKGTKLEATVGMNLDGATVKRANGGTVIEKPFNFDELTTDMQVFDTLLNKWRKVRGIGAYSFDAGTNASLSYYTVDGKLDPRHTVVAIDRMRTKVTDIATVEKLVTNKFNKVEWKDGGEKNFYVVFKGDTGMYSVFSETILRRVNTLFFSRDNAMTIKNSLNTLIGKTK